ncbi:uncharacterized protein LOC135195254 [Macrobrachium nipponense]|uniref:uncharacterized protein LOC135195254 n=1 Tax=Macrobrachium nipponense TaxID=159736 RepID=UPI0030C856AE
MPIPADVQSPVRGGTTPDFGLLLADEVNSREELSWVTASTSLMVPLLFIISVCKEKSRRTGKTNSVGEDDDESEEAVKKGRRRNDLMVYVNDLDGKSAMPPFNRKDLDGEEVGDFLSSLMDQELNTEICDQSEDEIGRHLCQFFKLCSDGNSNQVLEEISKMPNVSIGSCNVQEESSEMCGEVSSMAEDVSGLQLNEDGCEEPPRELSELEKQQLQDEADGWTVKRKGNKKR